ncbi:MAG: tetratricopeptide repeat protein [Cellulosilyticaceae bacterium]
MNILCMTIDWMKYYVGEGDEEKPVPLCGYNFQYVDGFYYGVGETLDNISLENFSNGTQNTEQMEDVLVVWLSKNKDGDLCVVGWYKNATVMRKPCYKITLDSERYEMIYTVKAKASECLLLPVEERRYSVNTITENIHFPEAGLIKSQLMSYIHQYAGDHMNLVLTKEDVARCMTLNLNYEQYFYKADEFLASDSYAKAIKCFNKAIKDEPNETLGYECKGSILLSLKMYDEAITAYEEVIKRDPNDELTHYCLGLLYGLKMNYEKALSFYDKYLTMRKEDANALAERGLIHFILKNIDESKKDLDAAIKLEPTNEMIIKLSKLHK